MGQFIRSAPLKHIFHRQKLIVRHNMLATEYFLYVFKANYVDYCDSKYYIEAE